MKQGERALHPEYTKGMWSGSGAQSSCYAIFCCFPPQSGLRSMCRYILLVPSLASLSVRPVYYGVGQGQFSRVKLYVFSGPITYIV